MSPLFCFHTIEDLKDHRAETLRALLDLTTEGVALILEGRIIYVNRAFSKIFGYDGHELIGREPADLVMPEFAPVVRERVARNEAADYRVETLKKDGTRFWCRILRRPTMLAGRATAIALVRDLTEEIERERVFLESEEKYRLIFSNEVDAIAVVDVETKRILEANEAAVRLYGYAREELLQMSALDLSAEPDETGANIEKHAHESRAIFVKRWNKRKDGTVFPVEATFGGYRWNGRNVICAIVRDMSEKLRAERALEEEKARSIYSERMASFGEVAAGIAHEINNPLAIIMGRAEQLELMATKGDLDPEKIVGVAHKIKDTVERVEKTIANLRTFVREDHLEPSRRVSVKTILSDSLEFCLKRFDAKGIDLRVDADGELEFECRPVQIVQVLLHLVNNAYDAVEILTKPWVEIQVRECGDQMVFRVSDSGLAIPPELRDKIMLPFFTTKAPGKGTGLGLSIAKGIIESHGGTIVLDDKVANTSFVVRLPRKQQGGS